MRCFFFFFFFLARLARPAAAAPLIGVRPALDGAGEWVERLALTHPGREAAMRRLSANERTSK